MALAHKHRDSIYRKLRPVLGEEETEALLVQFPAREDDEPATRDFVRAEIAATRDFVRAEVGAVRAEVAALEARMNEKFRQQTMWTAAAMTAGMTAGMGLAAGIATLVA